MLYAKFKYNTQKECAFVLFNRVHENLNQIELNGVIIYSLFMNFFKNFYVRFNDF